MWTLFDVTLHTLDIKIMSDTIIEQLIKFKFLEKFRKFETKILTNMYGDAFSWVL